MQWAVAAVPLTEEADRPQLLMRGGAACMRSPRSAHSVRCARDDVPLWLLLSCCARDDVPLWWPLSCCARDDVFPRQPHRKEAGLGARLPCLWSVYAGYASPAIRSPADMSPLRQPLSYSAVALPYPMESVAQAPPPPYMARSTTTCPSVATTMVETSKLVTQLLTRKVWRVPAGMGTPCSSAGAFSPPRC